MNPQRKPTILPFSVITAADLPIVGGKGANLGEMTQAGFPVPSGFCVTTTAFRQFMAASHEADALYAQLNEIRTDDLEQARLVGEMVRERLTAVPIPTEITEAIITAWQAAGEDKAYAVRSSATAEDLPDASFAGQQDTYLNIRGQADLLDAVRRCWVSLFTDRAILYRVQNGFKHEDVALSVVVQEMVLPEISGILFTADPISGNRHIVSIDASYGLGEALVAGLVSADLYKVDKRTMEVVEIVVAEKKLAIRPLPDGGTIEETISGEARTAQVLTTQQAIELAQLGQQVEAHYGQPQDIEWALAEGKLYLLQTRPITSLYPVPTREWEDKRLRVFFSFASVQGVMDPITPLGQDAIQAIFAGAATLFGMTSAPATQPVIWSAGERLWGNATGIMTHRVGRRMLPKVMPVVDPGAAAIFAYLLDEPELQVAGRLRWRTIRGLLHFLLPTMRRIFQTMRHPDVQREKVQQILADHLVAFQAQAAQAHTLHERLNFFETAVFNAFPIVISNVVPIIAGGMASLKMAERLTHNLPLDVPNVLTLTRGLPHNVTTEMDLILWQTAHVIQSDPQAAAIFAEQDAATLADLYVAGELPLLGQTAVFQFLNQYGMRGLAEIDFGRKRWREDPTPVMQILQSYLQITNPEQAPDAVFARGEAAAEMAEMDLVTAVRQTRGGRIKSKLLRGAIRRLRALAGLRESPKFFIIQLFGMARELLLDSGATLVADGVLDAPEDIFFLHLPELRQLANDPSQAKWRDLVAQRRQRFAREQKRRLLPRVLVSDGRTFYEGISSAAAGEGVLVGSPVSPGVVEGIVHVVFNPQETQLAPGEILVCPGTDPAWTPLFLAAGGLVMEVGGLMTHGSVVAREYGIPAVVGVHDVTQKLRTGQRVRVHGDSGLVEILSE